MKYFLVFTLLFFVIAFTVSINNHSEFQPVAWDAPKSVGFKGSFSPENTFLPLGLLDMNGYSGPEDITVNRNGEIFVSTAQGFILKLNATTQVFEEWAFTGGYPLGIRFDRSQNLIVADASLGLLKIDQNQRISILANQFNGQQFGFLDALDIDEKGMIYFSDASQQFSPRNYDGPENASEIDIFEHGGNGRVYSYDPVTHRVALLIDNLQFANGISLTHDEQSLLVVETAKYRVLKYSLLNESKGELTTVIDNLPGFPDNIVQHPEFGYWVGLTAPRSAFFDKLSTWPSVRRVLYQFPKALKPSAEAYGHVVHIDESGQVVESWQDPSGSYPMTTGAKQHGNKLYITSLKASAVGVYDLNRK